MTKVNIELTPEQLRALLDILTHHEAYAEIEALKYESSIENFGTPVQRESTGTHTSSPLIRLLLHKFILVLPGLRDVDGAFWTDEVPSLVAALASRNLSESYDKGSIGIRKTLSTAIAALIESVSRGVLGGFSAPESPLSRKIRSYNASVPMDIQVAWDDFLQGIIYGDLLDSLLAKTAETDQLSEQNELVRATHEYILIMFVPASD